MTAREANAFDDMFDMIFDAVAEGQGQLSSDPITPGIGKSHSEEMSDLALSLRRHSKAIPWTTEIDQELDRKKEEMDLCNTDQQLLDWAMREVFGESQRFQETARIARKSPQQPIQLQPPTYPHLIAILMSTFRDKYADPYLALAIFDHARHLSIASYVFGCTTLAYNELIQTRWRCFRDLRGVCHALEEMRVNGIEMNAQTRALAELTRREVGERNMWEEETSGDSGEVWEILTRIERLTISPKQRNQNSGWKGKKWSDSEGWKEEALSDVAHDSQFGGLSVAGI